MPSKSFGTNSWMIAESSTKHGLPSSVFAGTTRDGVQKSDNGGKTWTGPGAGFWALDVSGIASDPSAPQTAWVATSSGVWRTIDGEGDAPKTALELEVLVRGVFDQARFLDLLQHFELTHNV